MSNDRIEELEKETPVDTIENPEEKPEVDDDSNVDDLSDEMSPEDKLVEANAKLVEAERLRDIYKNENLKYRKQDRKIDISEKPSLGKEQVDLLKNDFISKKVDVLGEFEDEINSLGDAQWNKVKNLIKPSVQDLLDSAIKQNRHVARKEIQNVVKNLLTYAKGETKKVNPEELRKAEDAEMSGIKTKSRIKSDGATSVDKQNAELTGRTPEREKEIRTKREERLKSYKV